MIYDGVGSAPTLPSDYPQQLAQKGIRCQEFQPFRPLLSIHQNNRDHRKICVIDGVTGFVSGLNLADEYVDRKERFGYWKDNALRLRGRPCGAWRSSSSPCGTTRTPTPTSPPSGPRPCPR